MSVITIAREDNTIFSNIYWPFLIMFGLLERETYNANCGWEIAILMSEESKIKIMIN